MGRSKIFPPDLRKRIIVSGGAGFIGSHLIDRLLRRGDVEYLLCVDSLWTGTLENLDHICDTRLRLHIGRIEEFMTSERFDEAYHLASPASPVWYMDDPWNTITANLHGAMRLVELLKPGGRICYISTSEVYGDPLVSPQPESYRGSVDCTGPRAAYDEGKRVTEAFLFEMRRTRGQKIKVARLFNVYGPRTRTDDGRAVSNFISQGLAGGPLTVYGDGLQSRSWGYVDDIVNGLERFFWKDGSAFPGPVNIGNDREIPVLEIARYVADLTGGQPIIHRPPVPQDPTNRRPDLTTARQVMPGWSCRVPFEEGIRLTCDWFRARVGEAVPTVPEMPQAAPLGTGRIVA